MLLIDANAILRYLLNDNAVMAKAVYELIAKTRFVVRFEVAAEVVYVLEKVYSLPRYEIRDSIKAFLAESNAETEAKAVLFFALDIYADKKLDFVDCLLYGFNSIYGYDVFSFDKKLIALLGK